MKFFCLLFFIGQFTVAMGMEKISDHQLRKLSAKESKMIRTHAESDLIVLIAYGSECPILRKFIPTLNDMAEHYKSQKVGFFLVNTISEMDDKKIQEEVKSYSLKVPVYIDDQKSLLKDLGFSTFSESAVINLKTNEILYKGAINNQYTFDLTRPAATENYLVDAIESGLAHSKPKISQSKTYGCEITF